MRQFQIRNSSKSLSGIETGGTKGDKGDKGAIHQNPYQGLKRASIHGEHDDSCAIHQNPYQGLKQTAKGDAIASQQLQFIKIPIRD